jgi:hypothetical protein
MKTATIFVEGQTERVVVCKLLQELQPRDVSIRVLEHRGRVTKLRWDDHHPNPAYRVNVIDCGGDESVLSTMVEAYPQQEKYGIKVLIGLRDVAPKDRSVIRKVRNELAGWLRGPVRSVMCFAVMETEAWFLADPDHLGRLPRPLNVNAAKAEIRDHVGQGGLEDIESPAKLLAEIYRKQGLRFEKTEQSTKQICKALDWNHLYLAAPGMLPHLQELLDELNDFFATPSDQGRRDGP